MNLFYVFVGVMFGICIACMATAIFIYVDAVKNLDQDKTQCVQAHYEAAGAVPLLVCDRWAPDPSTVSPSGKARK